MSKRINKEKRTPNVVVFLVEGESDQIALETGLSELIFSAFPDYEVRFLLQQRLVSSSDDEDEIDDINDSEEDESCEEKKYKYGGDITTSSFVTPSNIEIKIANRFIKPSTKAGGGFYPKFIAKIIHIVDLDGTYLPEKCIVPLSTERADWEGLYYNGADGTIESHEREDTIDRNERKQKNIDYLLSLSNQGIKIGTRTVPYEIYFFSSNLDHFINNDANLKSCKKYHANCFLRTYGLFPERFCKFFFDDPASIGHMGYHESWAEIKRESNSVKRFTNIDCLIISLLEEGKSSNNSID